MPSGALGAGTLQLGLPARTRGARRKAGSRGQAFWEQGVPQISLQGPPGLRFCGGTGRSPLHSGAAGAAGAGTRLEVCAGRLALPTPRGTGSRKLLLPEPLAGTRNLTCPALMGAAHVQSLGYARGLGAGARAPLGGAG